MSEKLAISFENLESNLYTEILDDLKTKFIGKTEEEKRKLLEEAMFTVYFTEYAFAVEKWFETSNIENEGLVSVEDVINYLFNIPLRFQEDVENVRKEVKKLSIPFYRTRAEVSDTEVDNYLKMDFPDYLFDTLDTFQSTIHLNDNYKMFSSYIPTAERLFKLLREAIIYENNEIKEDYALRTFNYIVSAYSDFNECERDLQFRELEYGERITVEDLRTKKVAERSLEHFSLIDLLDTLHRTSNLFYKDIAVKLNIDLKDVYKLHQLATVQMYYTHEEIADLTDTEKQNAVDIANLYFKSLGLETTLSICDDGFKLKNLKLGKSDSIMLPTETIQALQRYNNFEEIRNVFIINKKDDGYTYLDLIIDDRLMYSY